MLTMPLLVLLLRARVSFRFVSPVHALSLCLSRASKKSIWYRCIPSVLNFNLINSGGNICMSPRMNCSGFGLTFALRLRFLFFASASSFLLSARFFSLAFSASVGGALTHRASAARNSIQHTMCVLKGPKATKLHPKAFAFAHTQRQLILFRNLFLLPALIRHIGAKGFWLLSIKPGHVLRQVFLGWIPLLNYVFG